MWKWDLALSQYLALLGPLLNVCRRQKVLNHFVFESAALCSVYERGGSAHGSPLLIFPMIPRLTLRGLDSALLLARPGYSPASIALFDSPSGVLSCLRSRSRVPPLSGTLNPALPAPPHPPPSGQQKPSTTGWAAEKTGWSTPLTKELQDKGKKRERKKRKLRYRADPTLACLSDSTIYGRAWDTAGAKLRVYTHRTVPKDRPSDREAEKALEGRVMKKGRWGGKIGRLKTKRESKGAWVRAHAVKGDGEWQEERKSKTQEGKESENRERARHGERKRWRE